MTAFATWLYGLDAQGDPALGALKTFATTQSANWPYWSNKPKPYIDLIRTNAPAADQDALTATFTTYYARWKSEAATLGFWQFLTDNLGKFVLVAFGIYFAYLLQQGLLLKNLDNAEQVRGMVTFFFVLVTTSVILLVALGIFWLQDDSAVKARFDAAKDLLTIVIGVLGTIMGFYFGSATSGTANLALVNTSLTPPTIQAGETATLSGQVNGGSKPYKYSVVFADPTNNVTPAQLEAMKPKAADTTDGRIVEKIKIPPDAKSSVVFFTLTVTDSKKISTQSGGALFIEPKKTAPAAPTAPANAAAPPTPKQN